MDATKLDSMLPRHRSESAMHLALGWLVLATAAVAASSLFAIMIVMARVPVLGGMFPGTDFYRVALTLHVDLAQWVWFMAFAGTLWALAAWREPRTSHWLALALAVAGALLIAVSPALGAARPLMSNYIPVLDSPWFLAGLAIYGVAVSISAFSVVKDGASLYGRRAASADSLRGVMVLGLVLAAAIVLTALGVLVGTWVAMPPEVAGHAFFESLFWGAGHIWQFCLTTLMCLAWTGLSAARLVLPGSRRLSVVLFLGAVPALGSPLFLIFGPGSPEYFTAFTRLMQWTSWQIPLYLGALLLWRHWHARIRPPAGLSLSMLLLGCGIILGAMIGGQTTLVTAHYHGTIGAVTLAFMGLTYHFLPRFACAMPSRSSIDWQLRCYGYGILLMMSGLAGAGLMGAPRKMAGNIGFEFGVETVSRIVLGLGGTLATIGILMFLFLVMRQLWPGASLRAARHG
jgi:cytochrome c oxidase subunit 1